jgi:hypothetical protein
VAEPAQAAADMELDLPEPAGEALPTAADKEAEASAAGKGVVCVLAA